MNPFARRCWYLHSLVACGVAAGLLACHEEVPLGGWPGLDGTVTNGAGGVAATVDTTSATASVATMTTGAAGDTGNPPGLPACLATGTPGLVNDPGPDTKATETATDWTWPTAMTSLEWELMVEREIVRPTSSSPPTSGYYYAHQFSFQGGNPGVLGIQAEGGYDEEPGQRFVFTKIATFWLSALDAELGEISGPDARIGTDTAAGIEYLTIHARFEWEACRTYRFRFAPHSTEADGSTWYGAWIVDVDAGDETFLGRMLLPATAGQLSPLTISRTMGIDFGNGCEIAHGSVLYGTPTADDGALMPLGNNRFAALLGCPSSRFTTFEGAMRHELGVPQ